MQVVAVEEGKRDGLRKLARDVGVNVLANLIAAAIIYLLAVAGGYLKANPTLIAFILLSSALLALALGMSYADRLVGRGGRQERIGWVLTFSLWLGLVVVAIAAFLHVR